MPSLDRNHASIVRAFERRGAGVVDLARIRDGVSDLLVAARGAA